MVDVLIVRRQDKAYLISQSEAGWDWILHNIQIKHKPRTEIAIPIASDVVEEMEGLIKKDGLDVEIK